MTIDGLYYSFGADFERQYLQILLHALTEKKLFSGKIVLGRRFGSSKLPYNKQKSWRGRIYMFVFWIPDFHWVHLKSPLWPTKYVIKT
jgi:hypothetical protein